MMAMTGAHDNEDNKERDEEKQLSELKLNLTKTMNANNISAMLIAL